MNREKVYPLHCKHCYKRKMEFEKKLLMFTAFCCAITMIAALAYWFLHGELMLDLVKWPLIVLGGEGIACCIKLACESKAKIEKEKGER